jgi:hypothetical protein
MKQYGRTKDVLEGVIVAGENSVAPAYYSNIFTKFLNEIYSGRWNGMGK